MNDVPRTANGWPTIEPYAFTLEQLIAEANKWRTAGDNPNTVGQSQWRKYTTELVRRGFFDSEDVNYWHQSGKLPNSLSAQLKCPTFFQKVNKLFNK